MLLIFKNIFSITFGINRQIDYHPCNLLLYKTFYERKQKGTKTQKQRHSSSYIYYDHNLGIFCRLKDFSLSTTHTYSEANVYKTLEVIDAFLYYFKSCKLQAINQKLTSFNSVMIYCKITMKP